MSKLENTRIEIDKLNAETLLNELAEIKQVLKELQAQNTIETNEYLTIKEVAELLSVSLSTVHNWTNQGILIRYKKGNRTYYKKSEVLTMFDN